MITVNADGLIIAILVFGFMCGMAGYVIGLVHSKERDKP